MDTARFSINYKLGEHLGWSECQLTAGGSTIKVSASYLSDALGQLATATVLLLQGAPSARVSFDEEPGEYRWGIDWHHDAQKQGEVFFRVRVWFFKEMWGRHLPDEAGQLLLDEVVTQSAFYRGVRQMLNAVLDEYGLNGYRKRWGHPFPSQASGLLSAILDHGKARPD